MAKTYLFGYEGKRYTLAQMEQVNTWKYVHPEIRRRVIALCDACPHDLGIGNGWRSSVQQATLFKSRYNRVNYVTAIFWDGSYWVKKPGVAPAAPPNSSYHESTDPLGYALAVDLLNYQPAIGWANANDERFGLHDFADVNGEAWHVQPLEIPNARRNYKPNTHTLTYWPLPFDPPVPPTPPPMPTPIPISKTGAEIMGAPLVIRYAGTANPNTPGGWDNWSGYFSFDGINRLVVRGLNHAAQLRALGALDAKTLKPVASNTWTDVTHANTAEELDEWLTPGAD